MRLNSSPAEPPKNLKTFLKLFKTMPKNLKHGTGAFELVFLLSMKIKNSWALTL
jgi:hypothetical protein